ncbi:hypothetical protein PM082_000865 [Marasmius tenuissimus]|nr:hypothetical protein PM082_000865 [Marasmius tenuissimus]
MDDPQNASRSLNEIIGHLPKSARARSLCEVYLTQAPWSPRLVMRDELIDDILTPIYAYIEFKLTHRAELAVPISPHRLAVLFLVLATATLVDPSIPPFSTEARDFFDLGKACLSLDDILESSELATLQALCLTGYFYNQGGPRYSPEAPWCIKGLCTSLVYRVSSLGPLNLSGLIRLSAGTTYVSPFFHPDTIIERVTLDSESPDWNLDHKTRNRRRTLFWEVVYLDTFYSLSLGRPPALGAPFMNCPFPDEPIHPAEAEVQKGATTLNLLIPRDQLPSVLSVLLWGWKFCKEVVSQIAITTLTPHIPDYTTILDLDKKIREHRVPPEVKADPPSLHTRGVRLSATSCVIFALGPQILRAHRVATTASIYIHRSFFLKAIKDFPNDPLRSPYSSSFLAAYNGASTVIQLDAKAVSQDPSWLSRRWGAYNSLLSAGVIVGLIVARCPTHSMAQKAFEDMTNLVNMFSSIFNTSSRARAAHGALKKMHDKATRILNEATGQERSYWGHNEIHDGGVTSDDDLEIFAGRVGMSTSSKRDEVHQEDGSSTSVSPQPPVGHGGDVGPSFGHEARGVLLGSSSSGEGLSATFVGDSFPSSSFSTTGLGFHNNEHQGYPQVPMVQSHPAYGYHETEHQSHHQISLGDASHTDWERMSPHETVPSPIPAIGGGMDVQWLTLMQEEGLMDPYANPNTQYYASPDFANVNT